MEREKKAAIAGFAGASIKMLISFATAPPDKRNWRDVGKASVEGFLETSVPVYVVETLSDNCD